MNFNSLSEAALLRLFEYIGPIERLNLQQCCKRFYVIYGKWIDIRALDIRILEQKSNEDGQQARHTVQFMQRSKSARITYRAQLTDIHGNTYNLKSSSEKYANRALKIMLTRLPSLSNITIWNACLGEDFSYVLSKLHSITTLRMWNSARYFDRKKPAKRLLYSLFSLPLLETILILDSTFPQFSSQCTSAFPCFLADCIKGPVVNLQMAGTYISSKAFDALCERLCGTLKRLALGSTYGKESRKNRYYKALAKLQVLEDLDIPPHIFWLGETCDVDERIMHLLNKLPLNSLGFRHYNSAVLFQFIEYKMPRNIRLLRVHHSANRVPNFVQLGFSQPESKEKSPPQKTSWLTSRHRSLGSTNSVMSSSDYSVESMTNETRKESKRSSVSNSSTMESTQMTNVSCPNDCKMSTNSLASRHLTIFAIEEAPRMMIQCAPKLRRRVYSGVQVFYVQESVDTQEMLGRIAAPMRSPYVYTRSAKREIRIIKGDLVRPIPLASLGMESDYEMSDWEN